MSAPARFWLCENGDAYTARQALSIESRQAMFSRILLNLDPLPLSVLEFGANVGDNLHAIRAILLDAHLAGVEPNMHACAEMAAHPAIDQVFNRSIQSCLDLPFVVDLAFTRGVLIHVPPTDLPVAYDVLYRSARRWVLIAEYYSPKPVEIEYRGQKGLLWKRDFAGEMLDRYPDLRLLDYGFVYHRDPAHPQDDVTWFVMQKDLPNPDMGIR